MAVVEGRGIAVAPAPKAVNLDDADHNAVRLGLGWAKEKYDGAKEDWKRGIIPNAALVGQTGAWALKKWLDAQMGRQVCKFDTDYKPYGDGDCDLSVFGLSLQVKSDTAAVERNRPMLIRRVKDNGDIVMLSADAYVHVGCHDLNRPLLFGWVPRKALEHFAKSPVSRMSHFNIEVPRGDQENMGSLVRLLRSKDKGESCR